LMGFGGAAAHLFVREGAGADRHPRRPGRARGGFPGLPAPRRDTKTELAQVVNAVMAAHGRLDILFNNAGVSFPAKVEDTTVEIWDRPPSQFRAVSRAIPTRARNLFALFAALCVIRVKSLLRSNKQESHHANNAKGRK
jgi:NAD(P)-dependent dehydrogenase (short-subunit alcohol dehydrogenase family)